MSRLPRRQVLGLACVAGTTGLVLVDRAHAMDRPRYGGILRLRLPLPLDRLDPHELDDLDSAILGAAVFDPLFELDSRAQPYPTLADGLPEKHRAGCEFRLRAGLESATGKLLDGRDAAFSLNRAAGRGARSLLEPLGSVTTVRGDRHAVRFSSGSPEAVARALASPLCALVPRKFDPRRPDGTGPFQARLTVGGLTLTRNERAPRGGSFLDRIEVQRAVDLADALRAFEAGDADVGWLGRGLHRPRPHTVTFTAPPAGWVVLRTGQTLGPWGAPGVARRVLDGVDLSPLGQLGLDVPRHRRPSETWRGPETSLLVRDDAPQLRAIAEALLTTLGGTSSRLRLETVSPGQIVQRRQNGDFGLCVDFVRRLGPSAEDNRRALLTAAGARSFASANTGSLDDLSQRLRVAVVGALEVRGGALDTLRGLSRWHLGDVSFI